MSVVTVTDTLVGCEGNDVMTGVSGNDSLSGGEGNDIVNGGTGHDTLAGGEGADRFVFKAGNDRILDFEGGDDDLDLSALASVNSFSQAMARAAQSGSHVVFRFEEGTLTLLNERRSSLDSDDFIF